jgi:hypothetical protein
MCPGHTPHGVRYLGHVSGQYGSNVGFELLTPLDMKNYIFCDIMQCSPLKVDRYFGGGDRGSACCLLHTGLLLGLFVDPEERSVMFLRNVD